MNYTELKDDEVTEGYLGIATSDFNFIILRLSNSGASSEVVKTILGPHQNDIT